MHSRYTSYLFVFQSFTSHFTLAHAIPTNFNLTAISASNNISLFQCWQFLEPITSSFQPGYGNNLTIQNLGALENATYGHLPANVPGAPHVAPAPQYVVFLSGIITVTIPETNQTATFTGGGANSIFIAADTQDKSTNGHVTGTGDKPVTLLQMPFLGGVVPEYRVLYNGACRKKELGFV